VLVQARTFDFCSVEFQVHKAIVLANIGPAAQTANQKREHKRKRLSESLLGSLGPISVASAAAIMVPSAFRRKLFIVDSAHDTVVFRQLPKRHRVAPSDFSAHERMICVQ